MLAQQLFEIVGIKKKIYKVHLDRFGIEKVSFDASFYIEGNYFTSFFAISETSFLSLIFNFCDSKVQ